MHNYRLSSPVVSYGLLRISNVTVPCESIWDPNRTLLRSDINFSPQGCTLQLRWSKTIQFHKHILEIALPHLPGKVTCPVAALLHFFQLVGPISSSAPAFAYISPRGRISAPTPATIAPNSRFVWASAPLHSTRTAYDAAGRRTSSHKVSR